MTAAAAAARTGSWLTEDRQVSPVWALLVIIVGGVVEGAALGLLQASVLRPAIGPGPARRWALVTVVVAGLGWAGASAPSVLGSGDDAASAPSVLLVLTGAALLGASMGALLGLAQSWATRGARARPSHWVRSSTAGWAAAMPVIFLGATTAGADWPHAAVVLLGLGTGVLAGAVLGAVTARSVAEV